MAVLTIIAIALIDSLFVVGFWFSGTALFAAAAGFLAAGTLDIRVVWICAALGAFGGEQISFAVGRVTAAHRRKREAAADQPMVGTARQYVTRFGVLAVVPGRFLALTRKTVPFALGVSGASYRKFIAVSLVACVLWVTFWCVVLYVSVFYGVDLMEWAKERLWP